MNPNRDDRDDRHQQRYSVSRDTWSSFQAAFLGRVKATTEGKRVFESLAAPVVLGPAYLALNGAVQGRHFADDAVILRCLQMLLHKDEQWRVNQYANEIRSNPAPPAPQDPTIRDWWSSPGRACFDDLATKFGGADPDDVSALRDTVHAVNLVDHRGNLPAFERTFDLAFKSYVSASAVAGNTVEHLDREFALHLIEHFARYDPDVYNVPCSFQRQVANKTVDSVFKAMKKQYDSLSASKRAQTEEKTATKALVTKAAPSSEETLLKALEAAITALQLQNSPKHIKKPRSPAEDELYEACKVAGVCYNNLTGKCTWKDGCRYKHSELPAQTSVNATAAEFEQPYFL
jgi:hypothetical protein